MTRTWMITGCSTGFGRTIAEACLEAGDDVVATARHASSLDGLGEARRSDGAGTRSASPPGTRSALPSGRRSASPSEPRSTSPSGRLLALDLDVTDTASVSAAVGEAERWAQDGIDVLVNNAGHGFAGAFEELTDEQFRDVFEVNLFGVAAVTRAVLPRMRERGRGHLVSMSSVGGVRANPGHAVYGSSKFALEGLSESLAHELAPFGIRVLIVEPGPFRTDFAGRSMGFADPLPAYEGTPAHETRERFATQNGAQRGDPERGALAIRAAVDDPDAPLRLPLGSMAVGVIRTTLTGRLDDVTVTASRAESADFAGARTTSGVTTPPIAHVR